MIVKLKICDWLLLIWTLAVLGSGILLEFMSGTVPVWVWAHVAVSLIFMLLCGWHIWLHFKKSNWFAKFRKLKKQATKILWWVAIITFLTGIIATVHWLAEGGHSPIGAIHGKVGFLMIILVIAHAVKRRKFYLR